MSTQNEKPVIFNSEMVRAILDGRKTQTRRIAKIQDRDYSNWGKEAIDAVIRGHCPYGKVGDKLYVRETFGIFDVDADEDVAIAYKADNSDVEWFKNRRKDFKDLRQGKWRSPYHMPKWAARIWLEITGIRVERNDKDIWEWIINFKKYQKKD